MYCHVPHGEDARNNYDDDVCSVAIHGHGTLMLYDAGYVAWTCTSNASLPAGLFALLNRRSRTQPRAVYCSMSSDAADERYFVQFADGTHSFSASPEFEEHLKEGLARRASARATAGADEDDGGAPNAVASVAFVRDRVSDHHACDGHFIAFTDGWSCWSRGALPDRVAREVRDHRDRGVGVAAFTAGGHDRFFVRFANGNVAHWHASHRMRIQLETLAKTRHKLTFVAWGEEASDFLLRYYHDDGGDEEP